MVFSSNNRQERVLLLTKDYFRRLCQQLNVTNVINWHVNMLSPTEKIPFPLVQLKHKNALQELGYINLLFVI